MMPATSAFVRGGLWRLGDNGSLEFTGVGAKAGGDKLVNEEL